MSSIHSPSVVQAVIFDLGNVLIPWNPRSLFRQLLPDDMAVDRFLSDVDFVRWNTEQDAGRSFPDGIEALGQKFPHYRVVAQAYFDRWEETIGKPIQESLDVMRELKAAGLRVLALTNFARETFARTRQIHTYLEEFEGIVVSGEEHLIKPDAAIYELLCKRYRVTPTEAVFIDDSEPNVRTASRLGMHAIHFTGAECLRPALRALQLPV